jgi:arginase family enzyme
MAAATLLGHGLPQLIRIAGARPALSPDRICLIGARSFEAEEAEFIDRHHIRVIGMDEILERGIESCFDEALAVVTKGRDRRYGVSLDLDAFDPIDAPGVGTPVPNGLDADRFLSAWRDLVGRSDCIGLEIVEYNPLRDQGEQTLKLLTALVLAAMDSGGGQKES